MSPDDRTILQYCAISNDMLMCPLHMCGFTIEVPAIPRASESLANIFSMTGATFDQVQAEAIASRAADQMRTHLRTHTMEQWLKFAGFAHAHREPLPHSWGASEATQ